MKRQRLDTYDEMPPGMLAYLRMYGWHFNKKMCEWAVSMMTRKDPTTGKPEQLKPFSKQDTDDFLKKNGVKVENDIAYDTTYVLNMARADYGRSSIPDDAHMAMLVKDYLDDPDGYDGMALTRFTADCVGKGIPVMWEDMLSDDREEKR